MWNIFLTVFVPFFVLIRSQDYPSPCNDDIYCHGDLLHTVAMAKLFEDQKTFVDLPLLYNRSTVHDNFEFLMNTTNSTPTGQEIREFVETNFGQRGSELEPWNPTDWNPSPSFLNDISDPALKTFALELNNFWANLSKKVSTKVEENPELYSLVYLPHPMILPGGRFLELYYWDTYWIIRGLVHCEMLDSVKGMLIDFLVLVEKNGYVPNGNRVYYQRSQPPLLISMFKDYIDASNDLEFLAESLPLLEQEFEFWRKNRSIQVGDVMLYRYNVELVGPRPESYAREYANVSLIESEQEQNEAYINIKSACESGWDFSSRWFLNEEGKNGTLIHTKAREIIPVDLNAFLYRNAVLLSEFFSLVNKTEDAKNYGEIAAEIKHAITTVLWDDVEGVWFDYDLFNKRPRRKFYPSNIFPLWAGIGVNNDTLANGLLKYLDKTGAMNYPGGIPTSMERTVQQWDFPNGWPPLQHLFVEALENSGNSNASELAFDIAQKWLTNNYVTYVENNNTMFEKYDVENLGVPGGGGYYDVVLGFGWTNGVILDFLKKYGDRLVSTPTASTTQTVTSTTSDAEMVLNYSLLHYILALAFLR